MGTTSQMKNSKTCLIVAFNEFSTQFLTNFSDIGIWEGDYDYKNN